MYVSRKTIYLLCNERLNSLFVSSYSNYGRKQMPCHLECAVMDFDYLYRSFKIFNVSSLTELSDLRPNITKYTFRCAVKGH